MASLFGSMATEFGGTLKEMAQDKREERLANEDAMREMQLEKQRMQHQSQLTQKQIDAANARESRRQEFETSRYAIELEDQRTAAEAERQHEMSIEDVRTRRDLTLEAMKQFAEETNKGKMSGNGWTVEFGKDTQVYDPETNSMVLKEGITKAWGSDGQPWVFRGDKAFRAGDPNQRSYDFGGDIAKQRAAEAALAEGKMTMQEFSDAYGYVPTTFITEQVKGNNTDFVQWSQKRRLPVYGFGPQTGVSITPLSGEVEGIVEQSSSQYGVPAGLIKAVMDTESLGQKDRTTATSSAGARGYMQLMPETAKELGVTDVTDPGQNIPAGTAYLSQMLQKYNGDLALALAAYNAGPTRVDKALKGGGDWMTQLPAETQQYIAKALNKYYAYTQQSGGTGGALTQAAAAEESTPEPGPVPEILKPLPEPEPAQPSAAAAPELPQNREQAVELSDEDINDMILSIQEQMSGQQKELRLLKSERAAREREERVLPHDWLFNTEKAQERKEESTSRIRSKYFEKEPETQ